MIGPYKDYLFFYYLQVNYTIYKKSQCQSAGGRAPAAARLHSLKVKFNQSFLHITRKHLQNLMRTRFRHSLLPTVACRLSTVKDRQAWPNSARQGNGTHHTVKCQLARARAAPATPSPRPRRRAARPS